MTWRYRVVRNGPFYGIHEYYEGELFGAVGSITEEAVAPFGESSRELERDLKMMLRAFEEPTLDYEEFDGQ